MLSLIGIVLQNDKYETYSSEKKKERGKRTTILKIVDLSPHFIIFTKMLTALLEFHSVR